MIKKIHTYIFRILIGLVAAILLCWSAIPISLGIINAGVLASVPTTFCILLICIFWNPVVKLIKLIWIQKVGRVLLKAVVLIIIALFSLFIVTSGIMLYAAARKPVQQGTVIVLGAGIRENQPSTMLKDRLDTAVRYLDKNQQSVCIVSGGQGPDEQYSEAEVMFQYLINNGIQPDRIYKEDCSCNTEQNIRFSKQIIDKQNLNPNVAIATQEFHQYRAQSMAKKEGLKSVSPCTCRSPWYFLECYWVREFAAICRFWLLGH